MMSSLQSWQMYQNHSKLL
uniref:Uncharacterized protein n=1 Tax=Arundo donax TaxID=35708 RepID=A0A0A8Z462_ARUDO